MIQTNIIELFLSIFTHESPYMSFYIHFLLQMGTLHKPFLTTIGVADSYTPHTTSHISTGFNLILCHTHQYYSSLTGLCRSVAR